MVELAFFNLSNASSITPPDIYTDDVFNLTEQVPTTSTQLFLEVNRLSVSHCNKCPSNSMVPVLIFIYCIVLYATINMWYIPYRVAYLGHFKMHSL